jgi:hypothetical protein
MGWLRAAADAMDESGSRMHAAATRRRLGQLQGPRGTELLARSERLMAEEGIQNIEAMTECLCPGCTA